MNVSYQPTSCDYPESCYHNMHKGCAQKVQEGQREPEHSSSLPGKGCKRVSVPALSSGVFTAFWRAPSGMEFSALSFFGKSEPSALLFWESENKTAFVFTMGEAAGTAWLDTGFSAWRHRAVGSPRPEVHSRRAGMRRPWFCHHRRQWFGIRPQSWLGDQKHNLA